MEEGNNTRHDGMRQIHGFGPFLFDQTELLSDVPDQEPVGGSFDPLLPQIPFKFLGLPPEPTE